MSRVNEEGADAARGPALGTGTGSPRTGRVFTDLGVVMAGFGLLVGVAFPPVAVGLGVAPAQAFRPLFWGACLVAGLVVAAEQMAHLAPVYRVGARDTHPSDRETGQLVARHQLQLSVAMAAGERIKRRREANQVTERARKDDEHGRSPTLFASRVISIAVHRANEI